MFRKLCGVLLCVLTIGYMLPAGIACFRNVKAEPAIFLLNLFLGWTLIGWIVALAWALCGDEKYVPNKYMKSPTIDECTEYLKHLYSEALPNEQVIITSINSRLSRLKRAGFS